MLAHREVAGAVLTAFCLSVPAISTEIHVPEGHPKVVLVELFTSEGCSDCPPADQLLRQLDGKRFGADTMIVGLSEHVTYWDHIGWKDPFSSDVSTERQSDYGQRFNLDSVYTPQMVVNGETQMVGGNAVAVQQALEKMPADGSTSARLGAVAIDGDAVTATVAVSGAVPPHGADIFAAVAEDEITHKVLAGENRGRTLAHTSVARALVKVATVKAAGETLVRLKLPPADAGSRRHLIVWVQERGLGRVLGVDSQTF
jgi:hypothetical protein